MKFKNRIDAARRLSERLIDFKDSEGVILAIPRGGVPMAAVIAERLNLPMDIILVKKLSHPIQREYAIGAVSLSNSILNDTIDVDPQYIEQETAHIRELLQLRYQQFYTDRKPVPLKDKTVIVVDDGIATGLTLLSTIEIIHAQQPKQIIVAIPVASISGKGRLAASPYVDQVICLHTPSDFRAVGQYYEDFTQVSDDEALNAFRRN